MRKRKKKREIVRKREKMREKARKGRKQEEKNEKEGKREKKERKGEKREKRREKKNVPKMLLTEMLETTDILAHMLKISKSCQICMFMYNITSYISI